MILRRVRLTDADNWAVASSNELLSVYESNEEEFSRRLVTADETWIHHWGPESKLESRQRKHVDLPPRVKFGIQSSACKVMAAIFWDYDWVLTIDYLPSKKTITGQYYAELTLKWREAIKQKRRGKLSLGVWLLHDNAPVQKSMVAQQALQDFGFVQLNHLAYSPDLAPSDCYLFINL
jgi:[histone H3]-lysine36 N-dimethyltransferase SETMAR